MKLALILPALAGLLAACAAPAPQYYSLRAPLAEAAEHEYQIAADYAISVQPVLVPEQVARPQIVVAEGAGTGVIPLHAALWAGPLEAQIRDALSDALTRRLKVVDIGQSKVTELPVWRIYVDVRNFDSLYGQAVRQEVVWRLMPQGMPDTAGRRVCSAQVDLPVGEGMSALVEGHRRAIGQLADLIAGTLPVPAGNSAPDSQATPGIDAHFHGCLG